MEMTITDDLIHYEPDYYYKLVEVFGDSKWLDVLEPLFITIGNFDGWDDLCDADKKNSTIEFHYNNTTGGFKIKFKNGIEYINRDSTHCTSRFIRFHCLHQWYKV